MSELLDLEKIEEDLQDIYLWPFGLSKDGERIAALVKRVREQAQYIIALEAQCKELLENLKPIFKAYGIEFCNEHEAILKRGSDEIES